MLRLAQAGFQLLRPGDHWLLHPLDLQFSPGQFWGLVGPNGSGKSTMLRLLSGEWTPSTGDVLLDERPLSSYSADALAHKRAMLNQKSQLRFPFSVTEVVSFGQFCHSPGASTSAMRAMSVPQAMSATDVEPFAHRLYPTLSGGEACRVDLARVLAQQTPILLLDEPTNHLDPRFQIAILGLCQKLAREGALVIAALHDLNLAARFCDQLVMLKSGRLIAAGTPEQTLCPQRLLDVYDLSFDVCYDSQSRPFVIPMYVS